MTVLLKILAVAGWLLLAVLLLLLWIIFVPRHFWLEYSKAEGFTAQVNLAFFRIRVYPVPDFISRLASGKKKQQKEEKQNTGNENGGAENKKRNPLADLQFSFGLIKQVVSAAKGIMKRVFGAIKFRDVSFTIPIHTADVLKTQQIYGAVTSAFYSLNTFLQKHLQLYYKSPVFVADFAGRYSEALYFYCKITASPVLLLAAAYFAYTQYTQITENNKKSPDVTEKEIINGQTEFN